MELSQVSSPDLLFPGLLLCHILAFWKPEFLISEYVHAVNAASFSLPFLLNRTTATIIRSCQAGRGSTKRKVKSRIFFSVVLQLLMLLSFNSPKLFP